MEEKIERYEEALSAIIDIAVDYDGYGNSLQGLRDLVDELRTIATNALNGKDIWAKP